MVSIINALSNNPTTTLLLAGIVELKDINLAEEPHFYQDLKKDVYGIKFIFLNLKKKIAECNTYGKLADIFLESKYDVSIWLRFDDLNGSMNAYERWRNRFFNKKKINANYIQTEFFMNRFHKNKQINN